jgi:hypothetical protein
VNASQRPILDLLLNAVTNARRKTKYGEGHCEYSPRDLARGLCDAFVTDNEAYAMISNIPLLRDHRDGMGKWAKTIPLEGKSLFLKSVGAAAAAVEADRASRAAAAAAAASDASSGASTGTGATAVPEEFFQLDNIIECADNEGSVMNIVLSEDGGWQNNMSCWGGDMERMMMSE